MDTPPTDQPDRSSAPSPAVEDSAAEPEPADVSIFSRMTPLEIGGRMMALLIPFITTLIIFLSAGQLRRLGSYGYPGIFLISLVANASIALPIPSLAVTFAMGAVLVWPIVGLVAGVGEALGETTGYLAGFGGQALIENQDLYKKMHTWMVNHGFLTILLLSVVPNPFFDLAGIAAGALRYPFYRFMLSCWLGKTVKTLFFAWAGANSFTFIADYFLA